MKPLKHKRAAREWLERAESDLEFARAGEASTQRHHVACFLCHQAVEKVLKALLTAAGIVPQKTHGLRGLLTKVREAIPDFRLEDGQARRLDALYIPSRYPGPVLYSFTAADAEEALRIASEALQLAQGVIGQI